MSKYTTQVRWIVENLPLSTAEFAAVEIPDEITGAAIGAFSNVMTKLNQDTVLNQIILETPFRNAEDWKRIGIKIIMHYYMKEIGYETVALWLLALNARLNLIMPYYNQLLDSADKMMPIDYFKDIDSNEEYNETGSDTHEMQKGSGTDTTGSRTGNVERTGTENVTSTGQTHSTGESTMTGTEHTLNSDTPQANYKNPPLDYATNLQDVTRNETNHTEANQTMSGSQDTTRGSGERSDGTEESHKSETGTQSDQGTKADQFTRKRTGLSGSRSYSELLQQYRDTILNIDEQIVLELDDLFMRIY